MAKITYEGPTGASNAVWAQDEMTREHVLPMGAMLDISAFADGFAESGLLVGRTAAEAAAEAPFTPYAADDTEVYLLLRSVTAADADEPDRAECTLYRHGSLVRFSALPAATRASAAPNPAAKVRELYEVM